MGRMSAKKSQSSTNPGNLALLIRFYILNEFIDREKTAPNMRDKATIRRLQMYRLGGKVTRLQL